MRKLGEKKYHKSALKWQKPEKDVFNLSQIKTNYSTWKQTWGRTPFSLPSWNRCSAADWYIFFPSPSLTRFPSIQWIFILTVLLGINFEPICDWNVQVDQGDIHAVRAVGAPKWGLIRRRRYSPTSAQFSPVWVTSAKTAVPSCYKKLQSLFKKWKYIFAHFKDLNIQMGVLGTTGREGKSESINKTLLVLVFSWDVPTVRKIQNDIVLIY